MTRTESSRQNQQAPCGLTVDAHTFEDQGGDSLVVTEASYACGCHSSRHEYHDGTVSRKVVTHQGVVVVDEMLSKE